MPELCKSFPDSSVGKESICNAGETGSVPRLGISTWRRNRLPTPVFSGFPGGSAVKNLPAMWETLVQSLDRDSPLEKAVATHSSILAWRIPWMEEPGRLQSTGSQRVRHD